MNYLVPDDFDDFQKQIVKSLIKEAMTSGFSNYWLKNIKPMEDSGDFLDSCINNGIWAVDKLEIGYVSARPSQFPIALEKLLNHDSRYSYLLSHNQIGPQLADEFLQYLFLGRVQNESRIGAKNDKRIG